MHPVHSYMDSFPPQGNQMPCMQHYYPNFEAIPPRMKVDTSKSPSTCETWPYGGTFGRSAPMGCPGCFNHSNFPGYCGFRPPYPYFPPPPPFHYHGGYPSVPQTYPIHYVPPPNYSMDQPRYEYDKNVANDHHCCGCPNHSCNRKEDRRVKIEEQEPELEKKSSNSLVPFSVKNQPHPVLWIPPEYMNTEQRNPSTKSELKERDECLHDRRADEDLKQFPFDIKNIGSLNHGGDRKSTQNQKNEGMNQFPFPIFWMPYKPREEERFDPKEAERKEENTGPLSAEKGDESISQPSASEENFGGEVGSKLMEKKHANQKTIPVKQLEEHEEKMKTGEDMAKTSCVNVKEKEDSKEKLPSENGIRRQPSSSPKTSKLPPVCLRVDSLPKRKNGNGSSRSPSPPSHKAKSQDFIGKSSNSASLRGEVNNERDTQSSSCALNKTNEAERNEKEGKVVEVVDEIQDGREDCKMKSQHQVPVNHKEEEEKPDEAKKTRRKNLSVAEAAVVIQSAYRGFEVRRWEPLKKMKKITEVGQQMAEIRSRIEALESSLNISGDDKQRVVIGETIMSLLLKLDTIQGLHPTVRDYRKSVAKELVSLQEKLDSLTTKSEVSNAKLVEDLSMETAENPLIQGNQNEVEHGNGPNGIGESDCASNSGSQAVQTSDLELVEKEVCDEPEDKITAYPTESNVDFGKAEAEVVNELKDRLIHEVLDDGREVTLETQTKDQELKSPVEQLPLVAEEKKEVEGREDMHDEGIEETSDLESVEKEVCDEPEDKVTASPMESSVDSGKTEEEAINELKDGLINEVFDDGREVTLETQTKYQELKPPVKPLPLVAEEMKEVKGREDMDGEGIEEVFEIHEDVGVKQVELLAQTQGEEVGHIVDHVETSNSENEVDLKENQLVEEAGLEIRELIVESQGEGNSMNDPLGMSDQGESQPEVSLARNENDDGEASKPEESLAQTGDNYWKEKEMTIEETKESEIESKILVGGENQEVVKHGPDPQGVESVGEERPDVEGEHFSTSPTAISWVGGKGSESDRKLVEENEKLREMMEKLIEEGREQLTAISNLSCRVKDLEKNLARKKKPRTRRVRAVSSRAQPSNGASKGRADGVAV